MSKKQRKSNGKKKRTNNGTPPRSKGDKQKQEFNLTGEEILAGQDGGSLTGQKESSFNNLTDQHLDEETFANIISVNQMTSAEALKKPGKEVCLTVITKDGKKEIGPFPVVYSDDEEEGVDKLNLIVLINGKRTKIPIDNPWI